MKCGYKEKEVKKMRLVDWTTIVIGFLAMAMSMFFELPMVFGVGLAYVLLGLDVLRNLKVHEALKQLQEKT